MVNNGMGVAKIKNRNGFPGKRITEFDNTPASKSCQRESTTFQPADSTIAFLR